ncbi:MAG: hypothetical protein ACSLFQ_11035 [Thermoanaerobaculia bacterium]
MTRNARWILSALILVSAQVDAALRYEYREDLVAENRMKSTNLTARAVLDGDRGRIDILSGDRYTPGTFILRDSGTRLFFVDPERKQYTEVLLPKGPDPQTANRVTITNPKIEFKEIGDGPVIAGYPTRHYRLSSSYEMAVTLGTVVVKQKVEAVIDKWTTTAFDHVVAKYIDERDVLTGKPDIDALLEAEASKFKGLALKQRTVITTTPQQRMKGSELNLPASRQRVREMEVTMIEETPVAADLFSIPVGFKKADAGAPSSSATYLTMEPVKP